MRSHNLNKTAKDRGIAMLIALFALLLLSVIGLGMMYGTNMETAINSNYRDKQSAVYAAMAGLQEARDRIQPATLNIAPPAILPTLTAAGGVIYIINPKSGETVTPWLAGSTYMDTELCQEHILGLSGTTGVPCTTLPTGTWYTTHDDSLVGSGVWHFTNPLDFKWVRITLKRNNMTPVAATGDNTVTNQVCWDGTHQILLPTGYGPECNRIGSVVAITVTSGGGNYTSAPTVTVDAPVGGGVTATAIPNMVLTSDAHVDYVTMTSGGSGYNDQPTVTFTGGSPSIVATGTVQYVPLGATVASVTLNSAGTRCYAVAPAIAFNGGGGTGAAATATLATTNSCIADWTVTGNCNGKKGQTISGIGLSGGGGSGFSGTLTFGPTNGDVTAITIQNPGTGYTTGVGLNFSGLTGCGGLTMTANVGKRVQSIALTAGGNGYTSTPTMSFTTGTGTTATQPTATATLGATPANAGQITGVTVTDGGQGYLAAPVLTFAGSSGTGATAIAHIAPIGAATYKVDTISVINQGSGYTVTPNVTITSGPGPGPAATATATIGHGMSYGKIYMLTAMSQTTSGARSLTQMEVATPVTGYNSTGALTIDGPNPVMQNMPNSSQYWLKGNDSNSCGQTAELDKPAISGYDDPNADPPTNSVGTIVASLPMPDHYTGLGDSPSVVNGYSSLGDTMGTPQGLKALIDQVNHDHTNPGNTVLLGSASVPAINYIDGDATLNGNGSGYGILVVTGKLTMSGDFFWHGVILVVGDGIVDWGGGGNGQIVGTAIIAKIWDNHIDQNLLANLGSPTVNWNGGGGNGIQYDHCWATNIMSMISFDPPASTRPLKILSMRSLPY